jgi:hypothetical protein
VDEPRREPSRGTPRRLAGWGVSAVVAALLVAAALFAVRPFHLSVDLTAGSDRVVAQGRCDIAARTAWNGDDKDRLALWSVTVGTNMMGYTPVSGGTTKFELLNSQHGALPDAFCAPEGRHRLIVSAWLAAGAVVLMAVLIVVRRRRSSPAVAVDV